MTSSFKNAIEDFLFVGDIHGNLPKLKNLWRSLIKKIPEDRFSKLNIVFLGDYIDRGLDSKGVVEFLVHLPERYQDQKHTFLCGNHEFGLAAFLNLPPFAHTNFNFTSQLYKPKPGRESELKHLYKGSAYETMHIQGRRWASEGVYESETTFSSYGAEFGKREALFNALPPTHRRFFSNLHWVFEASTSFGNIIAVHSGLEDGNVKRVAFQLSDLRERFAGKECFVEPLSGRENVINYPPSLKEPYLQTAAGLLEPKPRYLVSGHHGFTSINGARIIVDTEMESNILNAVMLSNTYFDPHPDTSSSSNSVQIQSLLEAGQNDRFFRRAPAAKEQAKTRPIHIQLFSV